MGFSDGSKEFPSTSHRNDGFGDGSTSVPVELWAIRTFDNSSLRNDSDIPRTGLGKDSGEAPRV